MDMVTYIKEVRGFKGSEEDEAWSSDSEESQRSLAMDRLSKGDLHNDESTRPSPQQDLGGLDKVPYELFEMIVSHLDMRTLTHFRQVNRRALKVIDEFRKYRAIVEHAPALLRVSKRITCDELYEALRTEQCQSCGDFASSICLTTCKRLCYYCSTHEEEWAPVPFRIPNTKNSFANWILMSQPESLNNLRPNDDDDTDTENEYENPTQTQTQHRNAFPVDHPCAQMIIAKAISYTVTVNIPHFDPATGATNWGLQCAACKRNPPQGVKRPKRRFTRFSFLKHLEERHAEIDFLPTVDSGEPATAGLDNLLGHLDSANSSVANLDVTPNIFH